jgi:hypothetical protein
MSLLDMTLKTKVPCHNGCWHVKESSLIKAIKSASVCLDLQLFISKYKRKILFNFWNGISWHRYVKECWNGISCVKSCSFSVLT